jgi:hypothetical protein
MRNPAKFVFAKYFNLWKNLDNKDFGNTFFDVEKWLHDTPAIPRELYKKMANDCYVLGSVTSYISVLEVFIYYGPMNRTNIFI